jgi:hypothetical protein
MIYDPDGDYSPIRNVLSATLFHHYKLPAPVLYITTELYSSAYIQPKIQQEAFIEENQEVTFESDIFLYDVKGDFVTKDGQPVTTAHVPIGSGKTMATHRLGFLLKNGYLPKILKFRDGSSDNVLLGNIYDPKKEPYFVPKKPVRKFKNNIALFKKRSPFHRIENFAKNNYKSNALRWLNSLENKSEADSLKAYKDAKSAAKKAWDSAQKRMHNAHIENQDVPDLDPFKTGYDISELKRIVGLYKARNGHNYYHSGRLDGYDPSKRVSVVAIKDYKDGGQFRSDNLKIIHSNEVYNAKDKS